MATLVTDAAAPTVSREILISKVGAKVIKLFFCDTFLFLYVTKYSCTLHQIRVLFLADATIVMASEVGEKN
jgi:hypothetical protein